MIHIIPVWLTSPVSADFRFTFVLCFHHPQFQFKKTVFGTSQNTDVKTLASSQSIYVEGPSDAERLVSCV